MKNAILIIPNKKGIDQIFKIDPPERSGLNKEKLYFLVSFVFNHLMKEYESDYEDKEFSVTLCSRHISKNLGDRYNDYIDYLIKHKVLILKRKHYPGSNCREYVLAPEFLINPSFYTIEGLTFKRNLRRHRTNKNNTEYPYLTKWLSKTEFDVEGASIFNNIMFEARKSSPHFLSPSKKQDNKFANPDNQYVHGQATILRFESGDTSYSIDDKGHRLHTPVTNCQKSLRNFLTIGGHHLVSIDIKNSQPYMLLGLISFKKNKKDQNVTPTTQHILTTYSLPQSIYSIIYRLSPEILTSIEFQRYKKMVANGTIYDDFANDFKFKGELPKGKTKRDVVKKLFMHCFYSENGAFSGGLKTLFATKFPKIYKMMCAIKENDHTALSIALQRIESTLVLEKICGRIAKENPNIPLLTIHDSILTTPEHVEYVVSIIKSVLEENIGIAPKLSIEYCNPLINKKQLIGMNRIAKKLIKTKVYE